MSTHQLDTNLYLYNHRESAPPAWPKRVYVSDCTLRDGEQQAGLVMSLETKVKIAKLLATVGVDEIEAGTPAVSVEDREAVKAIAATVQTKVSALARALKSDVDLVAATGAWGVRISFPAGMLQLQHKLKIDADDYLSKALAITEYAKEKGLYVIFSPYDTTRADEPFLRRVVSTLGRARTVDRFRVVDTTGGGTPNALRYLIRLFRDEGEGVPVEVHAHDDFGLATANTLAAVEAGAEYVSTTVNGLGERCGNAATEQVAAALELLYGVHTGIRLDQLTSVSRSVGWLTRTSLPPNTPVVGTNAFAHESGLTVGGLLKDPRTGEPYPPETVGQSRTIVLGKKSGADSIRHGLRQLGVEPDDELVATLLSAVKERATLLERALAETEFQALVKELRGA